MSAEDTLYSLYRDAKGWHARLAAWVGSNPKKTVTIVLVLTVLAALRIIGWVL